MLFSGGSAAKPKKDERKEKKSDRGTIHYNFEKKTSDEKYEIQETVFVRWGNSLLANEPLKEFRDLTDMKYISSVTHIVTGSPVTTTGNKLDDCQALLTALGDVKTVASDLAEGQQKVSPFWSLSSLLSYFMSFFKLSLNRMPCTTQITHQGWHRNS